MSDPENFVARWSRLKRENVNDQQIEPVRRPPPADPAAEARAAPEHTGHPATGEQPPFDVSSLPPIESITSTTDIRAFLQSGVPADLTKAALRRAWTADPGIRDFIGLAENQWDFTDPASIPGFGPLEAGDNVAALVSQAMGKLEHCALPDKGATSDPSYERAQPTQTAGDALQSQISSQPAGMPEETGRNWRTTAPEESEHTTAIAASQHVDRTAESDFAPNRRAHGRALPK